MDGLKTVIENILPYYGIVVFLLCICGIVFLFFEELIIRKLGEYIYLEEIDMIIKRKYEDAIQQHNRHDTSKVLYTLELQHPNKPEYKTEISVSQRVYKKSKVGGTIKMHEVIYKYKDKYIKRIVEYSKYNISKYNKCSQSSKNSFNLFKNDILNKCMEYDNKSSDKFTKIFPIIAIPFVLLFVMVFIINA